MLVCDKSYRSCTQIGQSFIVNLGRKLLLCLRQSSLFGLEIVGFYFCFILVTPRVVLCDDVFCGEIICAVYC